MPAAQDLSTIRVAFKKQTGFGAPASGASGHGIDVLPSTGLDVKNESIASGMFRRSRMMKRPRQGMKTVTAGYETELSVGPLDPIFEAVLGGTQQAAQDFSNTDWGALVISGGGLTATFASGTLLTDGIRAGMMAKFTNLSVAGNNGVWVPILQVNSETVCTFAPGYAEDNASDAAWDIAIAKNVSTATPYTDSYFSFEEQMPDLVAPISKYGTDLRFNSLQLTIDPKAYVKVAFGLAGRDLEPKSGVDSPVFISPAYIEADSLILLDGGIYVNGTKRMDLTSLTCGLTAQASGTAVIGTNVPADVSLGMFDFAGTQVGVVTDGSDFTAWADETDISMFLHCKEKDTDNFVSFYFGRLSYGGFGSPAGGNGLVAQTIPLYGGEDDRGAGYAPTTCLISTSAA